MLRSHSKILEEVIFHETFLSTPTLILGPGSSLRMTLSGAERNGGLVWDLRAVLGEARAARRDTSPSENILGE